MAMFSKKDMNALMKEVMKETVKNVMPDVMASVQAEIAPVIAKSLAQEMINSCVNEIIPVNERKQGKKQEPFNPDTVEWKDGNVIITMEQNKVFTAKTSTVNPDNAITAWVCKVDGRTKTLRKCGLNIVKSMPEIFTLYQAGKNKKGEDTVYTVYGFITTPPTKGWTKNGTKYQKLVSISAQEQHDCWIK